MDNPNLFESAINEEEVLRALMFAMVGQTCMDTEKEFSTESWNYLFEVMQRFLDEGHEPEDILAMENTSNGGIRPVLSSDFETFLNRLDD